MTTTNTALVTGASSGIGRAIASQLVAAGFTVVALARRAAALATLAGELGPALKPVTADVRDTDAVIDALSHLAPAERRPSVLVNNAGLALGLSPAHETDPDDWQVMIETNCTALVLLTRRLLPAMIERNGGHIVNIGSIAGRYPYAGSNVYGASKAFVEQFTLNLRADLLGTGVRATLIEPGLVGGSEFSLVRFKGEHERADAVYRDTVALTPDDVAAAALYAVTQPPHVNINRIELMPVSQAADGVSVRRYSA